jgi:capsular polysaccharide biosynthesis protein
VSDDKPLPAESEPRPGDGGDPTRPGPSERIGVLESMRWRWGTALVPIVVLAGLGAVLGLMREPTRTANARLEVRIQATSVNAVPGAVSAAEDTAANYARDLKTNSVIGGIAKRSGLPEARVTESVSASPIVDSPVVNVQSTAKSARTAVRLANIASAELRRYVDRLEARAKEQTGAVTEKARKAIVEYERRFDIQKHLQGALGGGSTQAERQQIMQARVSTQLAAFKRDALRQTLAQTQLAFRAPLEPMTRATGASSDFIPTLELLIAIGLFAGLFVGAALATFRANRTGKPFP